MSSKRNPLLKRVKKVNGYRVNHPYSSANFLFAFFSLLIALPIGILVIVPLFINHGAPEIKITGLELFKYILAGFKTSDVNILSLQELLGVDGVLYKALPYIFAILGGATIAMAVFSVFGFLCSLIICCKGYSKHPRTVKKIGKWGFLSALVFGLAALSVYLIVVIMNSEAARNLIVWYSFIPSGIALFVYIILHCMYRSFDGTVLEKDLYVADNGRGGDFALNKVTSVEPLAKGSSILPNNLTSIGNHQFSKDQDLQIAVIPDGIQSLGPGAFANCLNLRTVVIPTSIKKIGFNCFFNCVSLQSISYKGTKDQWRKIKRGSNWLSKAKTDKIICSDSVIIVNKLR